MMVALQVAGRMGDLAAISHTGRFLERGRGYCGFWETIFGLESPLRWVGGFRKVLIAD